MRVMVIGGGGREHALVWKIGQSPLLRSREDLMCVPGNEGIRRHATCLSAPPGGVSNLEGLAELARTHRIDFTVVGPELPLTLGIVDEFQRRRLAVFGASRAAARLEGSKVFAKKFMARHGIPTAPFAVFTSSRDALAYLSSREHAYPIVVKADGLAAGKGVVVAEDRTQAEAAVHAMLDERQFGPAGEQVVIEDHLAGTEASFFALTDGERAVPLATCQDFKRALDGDRGPNTGGMGAFSPFDEIDARMEIEIMKKVILPAVAGMSAEGISYRGVLYAGLMLSASGPKVLEFNARFGDPETQVLMPRIEGDILPAMISAAGAGDRLEEDSSRLAWKREWAACVVMASRGYPGAPETGRAIHGLEEAARLPGTLVFHAGTKRGMDGAGSPATLTSGGRVLGVSCLGRDLGEALERAYRGVACISFEGMQFRKDIGRAELSRLASREGSHVTGRKGEPDEQGARG